MKPDKPEISERSPKQSQPEQDNLHKAAGLDHPGRQVEFNEASKKGRAQMEKTVNEKFGSPTIGHNAEDFDRKNQFDHDKDLPPTGLMQLRPVDGANEMPMPSAASEAISSYIGWQMTDHGQEEKDNPTIKPLLTELASQDPQKFKDVCTDLEQFGPVGPFGSNTFRIEWNPPMSIKDFFSDEASDKWNQDKQPAAVYNGSIKLYP